MHWLSLLAAHDTTNCDDNLFFGIPHWAKGLHFDNALDCNIVNFSLGDVWIVALNVAVILLRMAGLVAVLFVAFGGFRYITSAGNPDNTKAALATITNAAIGFAVAILASFIVGYISGIFSS
ncbi:hypothetical protein HY346_03070 [Candidatus Microgenomates bacterium]|nr:hypothetical protein [Candidatus Microgenomates bacterium]